MFPLLGTGCPSCNMITVTTVAITVATELQVNKGEERIGYRGRAGRGEEEDDEEEQIRGKVGWSYK